MVKIGRKMEILTDREYLAIMGQSLPGTVEKSCVDSKRRGRPLSLPFELHAKLKTFLLNLRKAGGAVNPNLLGGGVKFDPSARNWPKSVGKWKF